MLGQPGPASGRPGCKLVPGNVRAIARKTWMAGTSPAMTEIQCERRRGTSPSIGAGSPRSASGLSSAPSRRTIQRGHDGHCGWVAASMRFLKRLLRRLLIFGLGIFIVWLIVFVVFETADNRL